MCFGTRGHSYGIFHAPSNGNVGSIKLVHLYGYVTCSNDDLLHWSFWGCGHMMDDVNVVITSSSDNKVLPPDEFMTIHSGMWFNVPGYNSFSKEIVLSSFQFFSVQAGQQFRLWYGEDLKDDTQEDNDGMVCADVYILYV